MAEHPYRRADAGASPIHRGQWTRRALLRVTGASAAMLLTNRLTPSADLMPLADADQPQDLRQDPHYLESKIRSINDEELFAALDLNRPDLAAVGTAVARADYQAAYAAWAAYWPQLVRRGHWRGQEFVYTTPDEAAASLRGAQAGIVNAAEQVLKHNINGWGTVTIQHGPVVDFNADYGVSGKYGFHYWGWAHPLVEAFLLTQDPKYQAEFDQLFNQWYEQRHQVKGELPYSVIYYELGLGQRNRTFLEYYTLPYTQRPLQTHERILKTVLGAARWLYQEQLVKGFRKGNWQIMGSYGLVDIGLTLPEFKEAAQWVSMGVDRIREHMEMDFFSDGCHSERVPSSYMMIAYRDPRNLAFLLDGHAEYAALAQRLRAPLERTLNWYLYALTPDGTIPAINDGARHQFSSSVMLDGARLYRRPDMSWVARHVLGNKTAGEGEMPHSTSMHFADSGFTFLRSDWTPQAHYMLINHGPSGGGHSHPDSLSFEMYAYGRALAIDAGIGSTYDDPLHKTWYKTSPAHNMLVVDEQNLDRPAARGQDVIWSTSAHLDYFAATQHGYAAAQGIIQRRHFIFVRTDYFLIYDVIDAKPGATGRKLAWYLHSPLPLMSTCAGFGVAGEPGLLVLPSSLEWQTRTGQGWASVRGIKRFSQDYAQIPWLAFDATVQPATTATFGVLLYPFTDQPPKVQFNRVGPAERTAHFVVEHPEGTDHILLGAPGTAIQDDKFQFMGSAALIRYSKGQLVAWSATQATQLAIDGHRVVNAPTAVNADGTFIRGK